MLDAQRHHGPSRQSQVGGDIQEGLMQSQGHSKFLAGPDMSHTPSHSGQTSYSVSKFRSHSVAPYNASSGRFAGGFKLLLEAVPDIGRTRVWPARCLRLTCPPCCRRTLAVGIGSERCAACGSCYDHQQYREGVAGGRNLPAQWDAAVSISKNTDKIHTLPDPCRPS